MHPTIVHALLSHSDAHASRPALWRATTGTYRPLVWRELGEQVGRIARGLIALGLEPGDVVCVASSGEWPVLLPAAMAAGARPALLDPAWSDEALGGAARASRAKALIVEGAMLHKLALLKEALPEAKLIVCGKGAEGEGALSLEALVALGEGVAHTVSGNRLAELKPESGACLVYSSGPAGLPRPVALTHGNLMAAATRLERALRFGDDESLLLLMPPSHASALAFFHLALLCGAQLTLPREGASAIELFDETRPTFAIAPPQLWERFAREIKGRLELEPLARQKVYHWARSLALERHRLESEQQIVSPSLLAKCGVASSLVHRPLKLAFGLSRARALVCAAGPLDGSTLELFASIDAPLQELYGQAETSGVTSLNVSGSMRMGAQGRPIAGLEARVESSGDLLVRGANVAPGTAEGTEGWLRTGDLASLDFEGFLLIRGSPADALQLEGGERLSRRSVEARLRRIGLVHDAIVLGDEPEHLSALLTLDPEEARRFARERGLPQELEPLSLHPVLAGWMKTEIENVSRELSPWVRIERFALLPRPFCTEAGELTAAGAVRRATIASRHRARIEAMLADPLPEQQQQSLTA